MNKTLEMVAGKKTYIAAALCILQALVTDASKLAAIHSIPEALAYLGQLSGTPAGQLINLALIGFGLRAAIPTVKVEEKPAAVDIPAVEKPVEAPITK